MKVHIRSQPVIETVVCEFIGSDLWGEAELPSINGPEFGLRRRNIIVGDLCHIDLERGSQTVEAAEETIFVHLKVTRTNSPARFPVLLGGILWCG